jgi:hypothetical protein
MTKKKKKKQVNAPFVETDIRELGDGRLSAAEACERETESLLAIEAKKRIWMQDELEDPERQSGQRLNWTEVIRRLRRCNPGIVPYESNTPGDIALLVRKKPHEFTAADAELPNGFLRDHKYITGFPRQELPEYSYVTLDSSLLPTREVRGWRSVLLSLVRSGVISYPAAIQEFGDPRGDQRSTRWSEQTKEFRK